MKAAFIQNLTNSILNEELPGIASHNRMMPSIKGGELTAPPEGVRKDAVFIFLYMHNEEWHIAFIKRPKDGTVYAGDLALPGGQMEPNDRDEIETALREANEELGLDISLVHVIGKLTPLYVPYTNSALVAVVGYSYTKPEFYPEESEVMYVVDAPLSTFVADNIDYARVFFRVKKQSLEIDAPYFPVDEDKVWGISAMILGEFAELARKALDITTPANIHKPEAMDATVLFTKGSMFSENQSIVP